MSTERPNNQENEDDFDGMQDPATAPVVVVDEPEDGHEKSMTFLEHLEELRVTLFYALGTFVGCCILVGIFVTQFSDFMMWPFETAIGDPELLQEGMVTIAPFEVISIYIQIILLGGIALSLPFMLYFLARFVAPGLTPAELRVLGPVCSIGFALFIVGACFAFFFLLPVALKAMSFLHDMLNLRIMWTGGKYYGTVSMVTLGVALIFEFPLALLLLTYLGVLTTERLRKFRRYAFVFVLVISAMIMPTMDPFTFLFLAGPLYGLYELSILAGVRVERFKAKREAKQAADWAAENDGS